MKVPSQKEIKKSPLKIQKPFERFTKDVPYDQQEAFKEGEITNIAGFKTHELIEVRHILAEQEAEESKPLEW